MNLSPTIKDLTKRVDLSLLYPPFVDLVLSALVECHDTLKVNYYLIDGLRDGNAQLANWIKGRKQLADGSWIIVDESRVVTYAMPWSSSHNYAIAVDACRDEHADRAGLQPSWRMPDYKIWADSCVKVGLEVGFYWKTFQEGPHAQLPIKSKGISTQRLKLLYDRGGMPEVWNFLDGFNWRR